MKNASPRKKEVRKIYVRRSFSILLLALSAFWFSHFFWGNYFTRLPRYEFWIANVCISVFSIFCLVFGFFVPFYTYDEKGIRKIGLKKAWLWKDVKYVFTQRALINTFINFKSSSGSLLLSPNNNHNYYEILNDILKFIPREKIDDYTIEVAQKWAMKHEKKKKKP